MADYNVRRGYDNVRAQGHIGLEPVPDEDTVETIMNGIERVDSLMQDISKRSTIDSYALEWFQTGLEVQVRPVSAETFVAFSAFMDLLLTRNGHNVTEINGVATLGRGETLFQDQ